MNSTKGSGAKWVKLFKNNLTALQNKVHRICTNKRESSPKKIKFTMSDIQLKINRQAKRPKNMPHNEEKDQSIKTDSELILKKILHQ